MIIYNQMVVDNRERDAVCDLVFHALADATRRDILRRVMDGERSVSALAENYDMSFAAVQKHVAVLERAELVRKRHCGRERLVSGNVDALRLPQSALGQLEALWRARIDRMNDLLTEEGTNR